jgi:hypothetical protein
MIVHPYVSQLRLFNGELLDIAWAPARPGAQVLSIPTIYRSSRFDPEQPEDDGAPGEIVTEVLIRSALVVPERISACCHFGDDEWWTETGWPDGTEDVALLADNFPESCEEAMGVQSVGLAAPPEYTVSGSPVTDRGTLSFDWVDVPAGWVLSGPTSGPDAAPTFKPPAIAGVSIPYAQIFWQQGTPLSGTSDLGGVIPVSVGDRVLTFDGTDNTTWGIWIVQSSSWFRAPDMPAGTTFNGPAYVWAAQDQSNMFAQAQLMALSPANWGVGHLIGSWVLGTDAVIARYGTSVTSVDAGSGCTVSRVSAPTGENVFSINVPPPGAGSITPGTLPPGVLLPPANLTPGTIPTSTILPVGNLTGPGTISPTLLPSGPECLSGEIAYTTTDTLTLVLSLDAPFGLIGGWNLATGTNQVHVEFSYKNANGEISSHTAGFFAANSWWKVPIMDFMGESGTDTPLHGPYVHFELSLKSAFGGSPSDCKIFYSAIAC